MAAYVRIKLGQLEQVVTEKAFGIIYGPKGWTLLSDAPAPVDPRDEDAPEDEPEDPFVIEVNRMLRRTVGEILTWIDDAPDEEARNLRAIAIWTRENSDTGRNRSTLLEALAGRSGSPEPGAPGVSGVTPDPEGSPNLDEE